MQKTIPFFIFLFFLGLFVMTGCNVVSSSGGTDGGVEYFPHNNGYSWTYKITRQGTTAVYSLIYTFNGTQSVGSITCQKFKSENNMYRSATSESLVYVTNSDVKNYGTSTSPTTEPFTLLKFPLTVGSSWISFGTQEVRVQAKESITVPTGTYDTFRNFNEQGSAYAYSWYAKDVGLIKIISVSGSMTITAELVSKNF